MALYRVSLMRYQPSPEKDRAFWDWYEQQHMPDLFTRPGWKRVRMCRLVAEEDVPDVLRPYRDATGQEPYLILLERYLDAPAGKRPATVSAGPSSGQIEFMESWLPHLLRYSTAGYLCDRGQTANPAAEEGKRPYRIGVMRYDVAPGSVEAFHQWYDQVHTPELFGQGGWRAVRRFSFTPESRGGPDRLQAHQLTEGQPTHLILLERELSSPGSAPSRPAGQLSHGRQDFIENWLPLLRNYTSYSYECLVDASDGDFKN